MAQRPHDSANAPRAQTRSAEGRAHCVRARPVPTGSHGAWAPAWGRRCLYCHVRHVALCAAMEEDDLPHLEAIVSVVSLAPGQTLFDEGEPARHAYNVVAGTLRLVRMLPDGRRQITGFGLAGDFVGLSAGGAHPYGAEAVSDVALCQLPIRRLHGLFLCFPGLERRLLDMRTAELIAMQDRMVLLGRKSPVEKIASFLLEVSARQERWGRPASPVSLPMTRGDIADYLGLTVETVSRCFTRLREDRLIALPEPTSVELIDRERLADVASGA